MRLEKRLQSFIRRLCADRCDKAVCDDDRKEYVLAHVGSIIIRSLPSKPMRTCVDGPALEFTSSVGWDKRQRRPTISPIWWACAPLVPPYERTFYKSACHERILPNPDIPILPRLLLADRSLHCFANRRLVLFDV
jgi:hypothetical protein